ncbi:DUF3052 domain-containing protein [Nocardioides islandensis]|uniref:DUF3052 domain-containing protein n=1 Tax=Nocardioides islandensis TaxID=433663 RepID=A0A930VDD1_9ACTN|nr:DUF3052 domain-containing protein [Nocardioides islandensis]MBF4763516.1 DUF3052 domain-containing protein [Nocardioides islandensis]
MSPREQPNPAGYSGTPLPQKLGIKPAHVLFLDGQPADVELGDLPAGTVVRRLPQQADVTITWHLSAASLEKRLPVLFERTSTAGMVWVCWPKKASKVPSDLDDNVVRRIGLDAGFVDVKVAAIDATWSGQKFVRRLRDR